MSKEKTRHIVLIGNYKCDRQESMERFAQMVAGGFVQHKNIQTEIWHPTVFFSRLHKNSQLGIGKWLGYADKWVLFPVQLRMRLLFGGKKYQHAHFHICDHSNAPYLSHLPSNRSSITCHDVLAIRGALGYADAYCPASKTGIILQKWILKNLRKAKKIAAVSHLTFNQLIELAPGYNKKEQQWTVIHNAFNADFKLMPPEEFKPILEKAKVDNTKPYILHIGSDLPRKNRAMLVKMLQALGERWTGNICFAGKSIDGKLKQAIETAGLTPRVFNVVKPNHTTLNALYCGANAFIFPSYSEGFGWPIIEAQACGCPVIASDVPPLPEVSGGAAMHCHPDDPEAFAKALLHLQDDKIRQDLISKGLENTKRFHNSTFTKKYFELIVGENIA